MEQACHDIEREIANMGREAEELLADAQNTIGNLSDLRYGRSDEGQKLLHSLRDVEIATTKT